ncbi:MAG: ankyrin repeat domain-containing protein [Myxococcota bacterium]
MGISVPPDDETLEGHWLWLREHGDAVHYRVLCLGGSLIRQGSGDISGLNLGDPTAYDDYDDIRSTTEQARGVCRGLMESWHRDGWVLATTSERTPSWTCRRVEHHLLGVDLPSCTPELVAEMRRYRGITRGRAFREKHLAALFDAAQRGCTEEVRALLDKGAGILVNPHLLNSSVPSGSTETIELLLTTGVRLFYSDKDGAPLHTACRFGHADIVCLLLDNGAGINGLGIHDRTPLHEAVAIESVPIVEILLARGCDASVVDRRGQSPIEVAAREGYERIVELLLEHVDAEQRREAERLLPEGRERARRRTDLHPRTSSLLWAAYRGFVDDVRRLLDEEQVPVDSAAPDGRTALFMAELGGRDEVAALLRSRGATEC